MVIGHGICGLSEPDTAEVGLVGVLSPAPDFFPPFLSLLDCFLGEAPAPEADASDFFAGELEDEDTSFNKASACAHSAACCCCCCCCCAANFLVSGDMGRVTFVCPALIRTPSVHHISESSGIVLFFTIVFQCFGTDVLELDPPPVLGLI